MIEENIMDAIRNWVIYGFHPGTHTAWVILGNYQKAWNSAHEHLKETKEKFDELYNNHRSLVPPSLLDLSNEEFMAHKGLANMTSDECANIEFDILMGNPIHEAWYLSTIGMRLKLQEGLKQLRK